MRRILSFAVLVVAVLTGSVAATQYLARTFAYTPELGEPLASVGNARLYSPFDSYRWQTTCQEGQKDFAAALGLAFGGLLLGLGVGTRLCDGDRKPASTGAHGTARSADLRDL